METLIRRPVLRRLIWVCTVCLRPTKRALYRLIWAKKSFYFRYSKMSSTTQNQVAGACESLQWPWKSYANLQKICGPDVGWSGHTGQGHSNRWYFMINCYLKTYAAISNAHLSRVCKRGKLSGSCLSTLNGFGSTLLPIFLCHIGVPTFSSQNNKLKCVRNIYWHLFRTDRLSTKDR